MEDKFERYLESKGLLIRDSSEIPNLDDLTVVRTDYTEEEMVRAITCRLFDPTVAFVVTDLKGIFTGKRGNSNPNLSYERLKTDLDLPVYKRSNNPDYKDFPKDDLNYPDLFLRARRRATQYGLRLEELAENVGKNIAEDVRKIDKRMKEFLRRYQGQKND